MSQRPEATLALVLVAGLAASSQAAGQEGFYDRRSEGWFWYEDPPQEQPERPEEKPEEEADPAEDAEPKRKEQADAEAQEDEGPEPYTTRWIRQEIEKAQRQAINNPTEENVKRFLTLQRVAVAKAYEFSKAVREVGQRHPELQPGAETAMSSVERDTRDQVVEQTRDRLMTRLAEDAGIWLFHRGSRYAVAQARILQRLQRRYDFTVQQVPIGEAKPVPELEVMPDEGLADRLGVTQRIELYAVHRDGGLVPLGDGIQAVTTLRDGLIRMAAAEGWIPREEAIRARRDYGNDPVIERVEQLQGQEDTGADGDLEALMPE